MTLRIGSLCSGYGGLDMAVQAVLGGELAWVADPDPGAAAILKHHHPDVPNLGDITKTNWEDVARVDLLCGGYPCQPFSSAGLQKGVEDERHIWPYIATALRVLRPRYALFENVANHLRIGFDIVLADLAALGFDVEWCTVRASEVGAPHPRNRLFILATAAVAGRLEPQRWGSAGLLGSPAATQPCEGDQRERAGDAALDSSTPTADPADLGHERLRSARGRGPGPADGGLATADAKGQHERQQQGQGDWRAQKPIGGRDGATADTHRGRQRQDERDLQSREPHASRCATTDAQGAGRQGPGSEPAGCRPERGDRPGDTQWGDYEPAIRRWEAILERSAPRPTERFLIRRNTRLPVGMRGSLVGYDPRLKGYPKWRLAPRFTEWLMGLPAGHVTDVPGLSRNQQLKALGNGVVPQQATAALNILLERRAAA